VIADPAHQGASRVHHVDVDGPYKPSTTLLSFMHSSPLSIRRRGFVFGVERATGRCFATNPALLAHWVHNANDVGGFAQD